MNLETEVSSFSRRVYEITMCIPRGYVSTYGIISSLLSQERGKSNPGALARAVGNSLRNNPFAPDVPCHRVIRSDLSLGGFRGKTDKKRQREKLQILESEGVVFDKKMILNNPSRVWRFNSGL